MSEVFFFFHDIKKFEEYLESATPSISVIIPAYQAEATLAECIEGVLKSAGEDAEIIVVDDASTDNTSEVARKLGCRVVRVEKNGGAAAARNRGAETARGDILLFLDSDVVLSDDAVPAVATVFRKTGCDALIGHYEKPPRGTVLFSAYQDLFTYWHHLQAAKGEGRIDWFWTAIGAVRRELFEDVGGFNESYSGASAEDVEFGCDISARGAVILIRTEIRGAHRHDHTLWSYVKNNFRKVSGLVDLALRKNRNMKFKTPFSGWRSAATLPMSYFMFLTLVFGTLFKALWWLNIVSAGAALIHSFIINRHLYGFIGKERNFLFGVFTFYCHVGTNLIVGTAVAWGVLKYLCGRLFGHRHGP